MGTELSEIPREKAGRDAVMKVFVVLAIAVLSGCHANLFYADEPKPQLEVLTDAFWDYVAKATQTADDTLQMIRKTQFGQDVNARLTESADMASQYAVSLQENLPPMAQDLVTKITQEAEALRVTLEQKREELTSSLEQSFQELQAQLGPYTNELKQKVDERLKEFQQTVSPMADNIQHELGQRAKLVKQMVAPYAEDLREKLDPYARDLEAQLSSLYQSFVNAN